MNSYMQLWVKQTLSPQVLLAMVFQHSNISPNSDRQDTFWEAALARVDRGCERDVGEHSKLEAQSPVIIRDGEEIRTALAMGKTNFKSEICR